MRITARDDLGEVPTAQAEVLRAMDIPFSHDPIDADLVIDALIGYSLSGDPRDRTAELIEWANHQPSPVLSLDTPSGLDTTLGIIGDPCVRATATMTLALPKSGLSMAPTVVGELYVADIGVPPSVYSAFGIELSDPFSGGRWSRRADPTRPWPRGKRGHDGEDLAEAGSGLDLNPHPEADMVPDLLGTVRRIGVVPGGAAGGLAVHDHVVVVGHALPVTHRRLR